MNVGQGGGGGGGGVSALFRDDAGVLHAPWRVVVFLLVAGALSILIQVAAAPLYHRMDGELLQLGYITSVLCIAMLVAHRVMFRISGVGAAGWKSVGLARAAAAPRELGAGLLAGSVALALPVLALMGVGWYDLAAGGEGSPARLGLQLAFALLPAALWEELLARGYLFSTIRERWGAPVALVVTSVGFGLLHLQNPGTNLHSVLQVTLAGFWLGGVLLATGSLYAAWMAHAAWNWTIAAVFHAPVSGLEFATPGWRLRATGPEWATGGAWGPEGGVFVIVTMGLTMGYLFRRRMRRRES